MSHDPHVGRTGPAAARQSGDSADAVAPADALGDVWHLLDALPRAAASPALTATTLEMAAVEVERPAGAAAGPRPTANPRAVPSRRTIAAVAVVAGSLMAGFVAGRATAPGTGPRRSLEYLPVVRNVELLREAGSVAFLEAVAARRFPPPRRPSLPRPADLRRFDAAVDSLRLFRAEGGDDAARLAGHRAAVATLDAAERRELERSAQTFAGLAPDARRQMVRLAEAIGDPQRSDLADAARLWHLWILSCDPADRQDIIDLETRGRLEWLERQTRIDRRGQDRLDGRTEGRMNDRPDGAPEGRPPRGWWERGRPPQGPSGGAVPGQRPSEFQPPPFAPPRPGRFDEPPRPQRPPDAAAAPNRET